MDEVDILVSSLETKMNTVQNELVQAQDELNVAIKYSEKLDIEERIAELKAREKVVEGYLKKGKKRLIRLRERYKELIVDGRGGKGYGDTNARGNAQIIRSLIAFHEHQERLVQTRSQLDHHHLSNHQIADEY
jgi:hypothetical protein